MRAAESEGSRPTAICARLAVLGDVHADAAGLRAVLDAIGAAGIGTGIVTGDLVLRGLDPEWCVRTVAALGWPCVQGNADLMVVNARVHPGWHNSGMRPGSRSWTHAALSDASRAFLQALPTTVRIAAGPWRVVAIHGHETRPPGLVEPGARDGDLDRLAADLGADCLVVGHCHAAFVRRTARCLVVSPGSVSAGSAADPLARWAMLSWDHAGMWAELRAHDPRQHSATS